MDVAGKDRYIDDGTEGGVQVDDNDTLTLDAGVLTHTDGPQRTVYGVGGWAKVVIGRIPDATQAPKR